MKKDFIEKYMTRQANYQLNQVAKKAGVKNFGAFHNAGYQGLYAGETANDIFKRKGLNYREDILDYMCSDELAANIFRISLAKQKIDKEGLESESVVKQVHYTVGEKVRKTIKELGGTLPEDFPTPDKSLREIEREQRRELPKKN